MRRCQTQCYSWVLNLSPGKGHAVHQLREVISLSKTLMAQTILPAPMPIGSLLPTPYGVLSLPKTTTSIAVGYLANIVEYS